jgi:acetylornithine aminotransferase
LAILDQIEGQGFLGKDGKIMRLSRCFTSKLQDLARRRPDLAAGPFGLGGMICFTPLGGDPDKVAKYLKNCFEAGVIGFIAGTKPAKARFLLPVGGAEEADIDAAFPILERVLVETAEAYALPKQGGA